MIMRDKFLVYPENISSNHMILWGIISEKNETPLFGQYFSDPFSPFVKSRTQIINHSRQGMLKRKLYQENLIMVKKSSSMCSTTTTTNNDDDVNDNNNV